MAPNPTIMNAVEKLGYRVTPGDVASQAGLDIKVAEQGLLVLASEAGGHLQVAESGDIAYAFPQNFRGILQSKYFQLQLQQLWSRVWNILFYLIRISFGILLIASIVLVLIAIIVILRVMSSSQEGGGDRRDSGDSFIFIPHFWFGPNFYWIFTPDYDNSRYRRRSNRSGAESEQQMNFFEAIFSFLFGDGNPNYDLEERRWQAIAAVIRNNRGAVAAEQISPYLDNLGKGYSQDYEEYMLPVLTRFNGRPEVSPDGQLVYHFPELQVMANQYRPRSVPDALVEFPWRFSKAGSGQILAAVGLGGLYFVLVLVLGSLLQNGEIVRQAGEFVAFMGAAYGAFLGYAIGFLTIPLVRYFWIKQRNVRLEARNLQRQKRAEGLRQANPELRKKLNYAHQFAAETVVDQANLAYTTEKDLTEQELLQSSQIDAEWRQRLEGRMRDEG